MSNYEELTRELLVKIMRHDSDALPEFIDRAISLYLEYIHGLGCSENKARTLVKLELIEWLAKRDEGKGK